MKMNVETTTTVKTTITLNAKDIREKFKLPTDAKVSFNVPTGGDYSGCQLNLDREGCIEIEYETSTSTNEA